MNLLHRVNCALCSHSAKGKGPSRRASLVTTLLPLIAIGLSSGLFLGNNLAVAQREADQRESAENRDTREKEKVRETEARSGAGDKREREKESGDRAREGDREQGFKPQTEREEMLYRMIQQLQKEVNALRQEVGQISGRGEKASARDGERREEDQTAVRRAKITKMFASYDKNQDEKVVFQEFLAMREGKDNPDVAERAEQMFKKSDRNKDGSLSLEEFAMAAQGQDPEQRDAASREGERPRSEPDQPRERDGAKPREGDKPRGDGEAQRDKPRGEVDRDKPRDEREGNAERPDEKRDRVAPPKEGARDGAVEKQGPRDGEKR